jgi:hypothetical protein
LDAAAAASLRLPGATGCMVYDGKAIEYDCTAYINSDRPDDDIPDPSGNYFDWYDGDDGIDDFADDSSCLIVRQGSCSSQSIPTAVVATSLHSGCGCVSNGTGFVTTRH